MTLWRWCSLLAVGLIQALLEAVSWLACESRSSE